MKTTRVFDGLEYSDVNDAYLDDLYKTGFIADINDVVSITDYCNTLDDLDDEVEALEIDLERTMRRCED